MKGLKLVWTIVLAVFFAVACSPKNRADFCMQDSDCGPLGLCLENTCKTVQCKRDDHCKEGEGCIDYQCQPRECEKHAETGCHQGEVWWFDGCGQPEERLTPCPNGCQDGRCLGCSADEDCADGNVCNGEEACDLAANECMAGSPRADGFVCLVEPRSICLQAGCKLSACGDGYIDAGLGESCEPPSEGDCDAECQKLCTSAQDCPDDDQACNGEEYCDLDTERCSHREPLPDGTPCGTGHAMICLASNCQPSACGDGYIDRERDEECDDQNEVEGDGCDNDCSYSCHTGSDCEDDHACTDDVCDPQTHVCQYPLSTPETLCRVSAGVCDPAEFCDGQNPDCPEDALASSAVICRAAAGACDLEETCTGTTPACPQDVLRPADTLCRHSAGACDPEEHCTGQLPECPKDGLAPSWEVCRPAAGACDPAESCTGVSPACPPDEFHPETTMCRPGAGDCDPAEYCTSITPECPADDLAPPGVTCRPSAGACDVAESCTGATPSCPPDGFLPAESVCRAVAGACDRSEYCTGSSALCPDDALTPKGTVCRPAAGDCDAEDTCTGSSPSCPSDAMLPPWTVCRNALGDCDLEEYCTGSTVDCPTDSLVAAGDTCRPAADVCDDKESCNGVSPTCPPDGVLPSTTVCRPANSACDISEYCDGESIACPPNATNCAYYTRPVVVDNTSNSQTLSDYQVQVLLDTQALIGQGKMLPDCADIRFVDSDQSTNLPYWLEAGCNTTTTRFWVKVYTIPALATKTIYVRYGGDGWTSQSSISSTFPAGSDFQIDDGLTFVEKGVMEPFGDMGGNLKSGSGRLTFSSLERLENTYVYSQLPVTMTDGYAVRARVRVTAEPSSSGFFVQPLSISQLATAPLASILQYSLEIVWDSGYGWIIVESYGDSYKISQKIESSLGSWTIVEMTKSGSSATLKGYTDLSYTNLGSVSLTLSVPDAGRRFLHHYMKRDPSWPSHSSSGDQDWALVRKYSSPEPATSVGSEAQ